MAKIDTTEQLFRSWASTKDPATKARLVGALQPDIDRAIRSAGASVSPLTRGVGKQVIFDAIESFNPDNKTQFRTWANSQLQRLQRDLRPTRFSARIPELRSRESRRLYQAVQDIESETGYPPSDSQLADRLGLSLKKIRNLRKLGGTDQVPDEEVSGPQVADDNDEPTESGLIMDMVYHDLAPKDQSIFELALGYNGVASLPSKEVARKMKVSPAYVSKRLKVIQDRLKEAEEVLDV